MSSGTKRQLAEMRCIAEAMRAELGPFVERIHIAGSIRRLCPQVGDIELVCVPRIEVTRDLLGAEIGSVNLLDRHCEEQISFSTWAHRLDKNGRTAFGERAKRITAYGVPVDLFSVLPPAQFGLIYAVRTGPADFSRRLITRRSQGGMLPNDLEVKDGAVRRWSTGEVIHTPEERDLFALLGIDWTDPADRA